MTEAPKDYQKKGNALLDTGDYQGAIQCYEKALEKDKKGTVLIISFCLPGK